LTERLFAGLSANADWNLNLTSPVGDEILQGAVGKSAMLVGRLALFFGLLLAVAASQIPEYAQQYRQRLGGAIDELQAIVARFDQDSAREGLTEQQGLARLAGNGDEFVRGRGLQMRDVVERLKTLSRADAAMTRSGPLGRLIVLVGNFDPLIARRAYASYEPAVPVTSEGFGLAALGFLIGVAFTRLIAMPFRRFGRRDRHLPAPSHR
jgi:hypothetical protein